MLCLLVGVRRVYANAIKHCRQRGSVNFNFCFLFFRFLNQLRMLTYQNPKIKRVSLCVEPKRKTKLYLNFNGSVSPCAVVRGLETDTAENVVYTYVSHIRGYCGQHLKGSH